MSEQRSSSTLVIEITREEDHLRVGLHAGSEPGAETLLPYELKPYQAEELAGVSRQLFQVMNAFNEDGRLAEHSLRELKQLGGLMLDLVFPAGMKAELVSSRASCMLLRIDSDLVYVPWELLFDGQQFFCLRWEMGRVVRTPQKPHPTFPRSLSLPLRMLVVADPRGDLPSAYQEGVRIRDLLDRSPEEVEGELLSQRVSPEEVRRRLKDSDVFHYAGHADYVPDDPSRSGWLLQGGKFTAGHVLEMAGCQGMPSLVFVNACRSGQTAVWSGAGPRSREIFGLANAFLLAGAGHYVGTFWEIQDEPSSRFALRFYERLMAGTSVGRALQEARKATIREYGESAIVWATYMLYGEPAFVYAKTDPVRETGSPRRIWTGVPAHGGEAARFRGTPGAGVPNTPAGLAEGVDPGHRSGGWRSRVLRVSAVLLLLGVVLGGLWMFRGLEQDRRQAEALEARGDLEGAARHYEKVLDRDPRNRDVRVRLCGLLNRLGRFAESGECFAALMPVSGEDRLAASLHQSLESLLAENREQWRTERADALLDQLVETMREREGQATPAEAGAPWTSKPLTLAFLDLEALGGSPGEAGEGEQLLLWIQAALRKDPRVRIVDRAVLVSVLQELKLGANSVSETSQALQLGKLLPAHLLIVGSLYRDPTTDRVHLRFIETETSRLAGALSHDFAPTLPRERAGEEVAGKILDELRSAYPLRGTIVSLDESGNAVLDLGGSVGVREGATFQVFPAGSTDPAGSPLALVRVTRVTEHQATASLPGDAHGVAPGCRVLEAPGPES